MKVGFIAQREKHSEKVFCGNLKNARERLALSSDSVAKVLILDHVTAHFLGMYVPFHEYFRASREILARRTLMNDSVYKELLIVFPILFRSENSPSSSRVLIIPPFIVFLRFQRPFPRLPEQPELEPLFFAEQHVLEGTSRRVFISSGIQRSFLRRNIEQRQVHKFGNHYCLVLFVPEDPLWYSRRMQFLREKTVLDFDSQYERLGSEIAGG